MFSGILILFALPWLDHSKVKSASYRPLFRIMFWVFIFDVIALGYLGGKPPEGAYIFLGRFATAYYFTHFMVVLPFVSRYEKPLPLPKSISSKE